MTATVTPNTAGGACSRPPWWTHPICTNLALKSCAGGRERVTRDFLVHMDRLGMLPQVVEPGKPPRTMALEGAFPGMFANMASQMFAPCKAQIARRKISTEKPLAFLLFGGRGVP